MQLSIDLPLADSAGSFAETGGIRLSGAGEADGFTRLLRNFAAPRDAAPDVPPGTALPQGGNVLPVAAGSPERGAAPGAESLVPLIGVGLPVVEASESVGATETDASLAVAVGDSGLHAVAAGVLAVGDRNGTRAVALQYLPPDLGAAAAATAATPAVSVTSVARSSPVVALDGPSLALEAEGFDFATDRRSAAAGTPVVASAAAVAATAAGDRALQAGAARELPLQAVGTSAGEPAPMRDAVTLREAVALHRMSMELLPPSLPVADRATDATAGRSAEALVEAFVGRLFGGAAATAGPSTLTTPLTGSPAPAGAATASLPAIATPLQDPGFSRVLGERVLFMTGRTIPTAEIRMVPAELGPVTVNVTVEDGRAELSFAAHHPQTREAIELALPRLREMLAEQGLSLGHASVTDQGPQRDGRDAAAGTPGLERGRDGQAVDTALDPGTGRVERALRGLVDTFA